VKSIISLESGWTYSYVILGPNFEPSVITIPLTAQAMVEKIDRFGNVSTALDFIAFDKKIGGFGSGELRLIDDIAYDIFMANKGFALGVFPPGEGMANKPLPPNAERTIGRLKKHYALKPV
jgi:hypothetical protein